MTVINGFNYLSIDAQKYWSFPSSYSEEKKREQLNTVLYSNEYVGSNKEDGYWEMFIKDEDGELTMRARNKGVNGWVCKQDWVPHLHDFFDELPNGTVVIGEVYLPGKTSRAITSILGCGVEKAIQRQIGVNKLHLSIFDILAYNGLLIHDLPMIERLDYLRKLESFAEGNQYVKLAEYWTSPDEIHENWIRILEEGGEGIVMTRKDYPYGFGSRPARKTIKLKKELQDTIDVFLTGKWKEATKEYTGTELETWEYWYDDLTGERIKDGLHKKIDTSGLVPVTRLWFNRWAGAVEIGVILNGEVTPIGHLSGITDEVRQGIVGDNEEWTGKVIELQAMEITYASGKPAFRHGKIVRWRDDKKWQECEWKA